MKDSLTNHTDGDCRRGTNRMRVTSALHESR